MGSRMYSYCQDDYCFDDERCIPEGNVSSLIYKRDDDSFILTQLTFPFSLNCSGNSNTTYWSVYFCSASDILQSGSCDATGDPTYGAGVSSMKTFSPGFVFPPLSFRGLTTSFYPNAENCQAGTRLLYQSAYMGDRCIPMANSNGSEEFVNNHDWISFNAYPSSAHCAGKPATRASIDATIYCVATNWGGPDDLLTGAFSSQAFTSSVSADLQLKLRYVLMWWQIKTAVATTSCASSALMIFALARINNWTFFNKILLPLTIWQLVFDLTVVAGPYREVLVQEGYSFTGSGRDNYKRFAIRELFKEWAILNVFFITNLITFAVGYIFHFQRALQLDGRLLAGVFAVVAILAALAPMSLVVIRLQEHTDTDAGLSKNASIETLLKTIGALKIVSIALNVILTIISLLRQSRRTLSLLPSDAPQDRPSGVSAAAEKDKGEQATSAQKKVANVLIRRLLPYPVILGITQLWSVWDFLSYVPRMVHMSTTNTNDDSFYKTQAYDACWFLQSLLQPLAGALFFTAFVALSKEVRRTLRAMLLALVSLEDSAGRQPEPVKKTRVSVWDDGLRPVAVDAASGDEKQRARTLEAILADQGFRAKSSLAPVFAALYSNDEERLAMELAQPGTDVNAVGVDGRCAAVVAAEDGKLGCLRVLAAHGAELNGLPGVPGSSPAQVALQSGRLACLEYLYSRGADPEEGVTVLHVLAALGMAARLEVLLEADARTVDACDTQGRTAAHWACQYGQVSSLEVLVGHRADLGSRDIRGVSLVHLCAIHGRADCLQFLCEAGADWDTLDGDGDTAAFKALMRSQFESFLILERKGADVGDVNKCDEEGKSGCFLAAAAGNSTVLELLLFKHDALFLSKRAGLLSPQERRVRAQLFLAFAVFVGVIIGAYEATHAEATRACRLFFDADNGFVLTPYVVIFAYVFIFQIAQFVFEEMLAPAFSFLRFYLAHVTVIDFGRCRSLPALGRAVGEAKIAPCSIIGANEKRGSQVELGAIYARDVIPDQIVSNPLAGMEGHRISWSGLEAATGGSEAAQREQASAGLSRASASKPTARRTHGTVWSLLLARLDQRVVKHWRLMKYLSASKNDVEYQGSEVWMQTQYLFLYLQIANVLFSVAVACVKVDRRASSWAQYENFFGLVINSGLTTTVVSVLKMYLGGRGKQIVGLSLANKAFICTPFVILLPPLLTHIFPALASYCWTVFFLLACRRVVVTARSLRLSRLRVGTSFISPKLRTYFAAFGAEVATRLVFVFLLQTMYNYGALLYAQPQPLSAAGYVRVMTTDLELRSQTYCFLHPLAASLRDGLMYLSFI